MITSGVVSWTAGVLKVSVSLVRVAPPAEEATRKKYFFPAVRPAIVIEWATTGFEPPTLFVKALVVSNWTLPAARRSVPQTMVALFGLRSRTNGRTEKTGAARSDIPRVLKESTGLATRRPRPSTDQT